LTSEQLLAGFGQSRLDAATGLRALFGRNRIASINDAHRFLIGIIQPGQSPISSRMYAASSGS
jgi:hypothetical protein